jgi:hypothetical protein
MQVRLLLHAVRERGLHRADGHGRRRDPGEHAGDGRRQSVREGGGEGDGQGDGAGVSGGKCRARKGQGAVHAVCVDLRPRAVHARPDAAGVRAVPVHGRVKVRPVLRRAAGVPDQLQQLQGALRDLSLLLPARRRRRPGDHRHDKVQQDRRAFLIYLSGACMVLCVTN